MAAPDFPPSVQELLRVGKTSGEITFNQFMAHLPTDDDPNSNLISKVIDEIYRQDITLIHDANPDPKTPEPVAAKPAEEWSLFEERKSTAFANEPVVSCYLGKVYHFWEGRNAFWGVWSNKYPGFASFHPNRKTLTDRIESRRKQGSQWVIFELCALVIAGTTHALTVCEINTNSPLERWAKTSAFPSTLAEIGQLFVPASSNTVFRFTSRRSEVSPAQLPFYEHRSVSFGPGYLLGWRSKPTQQSLQAPMALVGAISHDLQRRAKST